MTMDQSNVVKADETTPLIPQTPPEPAKYGKSVLYRALLCGFVVSLSFGVTQVPYVIPFHLDNLDAHFQLQPSLCLPSDDM